jgi:glycosyltransferase involved in cell wall biosynthesis
MTTPLISCVVPVFNGERYIREALDSILGQTYRHLEVIVADDGSTDGTAAAVAEYGDRVSYVRQPNAGPAAARNLGLGAAQGEYVAFLDADDLWHPEKLARQVARFRARPELHGCVTHVQNFWVPELHQEAERLRDHRRGQPLPGYCPSALMARRTVFETVGRFDTTLTHADDTDWFLRAAERDIVIELLADVLVYRRLHPANFSRLVAGSQAEYLRIVKAWLDRRRRADSGPPTCYPSPTVGRDETG